MHLEVLELRDHQQDSLEPAKAKSDKCGRSLCLLNAISFYLNHSFGYEISLTSDS
jgi:hypothetical protein